MADKQRKEVKAPISNDPAAAFDALAAELAPVGTTRGQMFGMPCLKVGGKAIAGLCGVVGPSAAPAGIEALNEERLRDPRHRIPGRIRPGLGVMPAHAFDHGGGMTLARYATTSTQWRLRWRRYAWPPARWAMPCRTAPP